MKCLERNKRPFWYCLYTGKQEIVNEDGYGTGQYIVTYAAPVQMRANISQATGQSNTEQFGNLDNYDKVIVLDDLNCPIDESTVLFIDKAPEFTNITTYETTAITTVAATVSVPTPDYIVRRVAKSLNSVSIAVKKVEIS